MIVGINQRAKEYYKTIDNGKIIATHRLVWTQHHGKIPEDHCIHHINGDKKDNRIENLECLTRKEHGLRHRKLNRVRIQYPSGAIAVRKIDSQT